MAEPTPPPAPAQPLPKPPGQNQALRMLGIPNLPSKLPSRNWLIFWAVTTTITGAIIYDKREKKRTTARWAHAVEHLAKEPLPNGLAQVRKLTIYLSSPPGNGLRVAQDHYTEYVKPILAASGLDWEFVQGRREGDIRAVVAERARKIRRGWETAEDAPADHEPTKDEIVEAHRKRRGIPDYEGVRGEVIIGRHTWKEYVRGLHEGWLGPLAPPPKHEPLPETPVDGDAADEKKPAEEKKPEEETPKPTRPPQPRPHNTPNDYLTETLPLLTPSEFSPVVLIPEPHILGFLSTPKRMYRFFNRRKLADDIGREVAAACLLAYRDFKELPAAASDSPTADQVHWEQERELEWEEKDWIKTVWKEDDPKEAASTEVTEKILARPMVLDQRVASRMRRFELLPEDEERAKRVKVPEEEVEGWTKGKLRALFRWGASQFKSERRVPVTDSEEE